MTDEEFRAFMANLAVEQDRRHAQLEAQLAETRAQLEVKLVESHTKLEIQLAKTDAQLAKTDAQLAKTDAQLAKTDAQLNKLSKLFGDVNNNRGEVAEEFFFSSLKKYPQIGSIKFDIVHRNLHGAKGGIHDEFDLVLTNGDALALIEIKTKAHIKLVNEIIEKKIPHLRTLFPHFKDYKIYAGIASLVSYEELATQTAENGLFLLTQQGKHLEITTENMHSF